MPSDLSADLQDLLKNIINWDSEKRFSMSQIINHTFFTGNKFSFCVPSTNNNTNIAFQHNPVSNNNNNFINLGGGEDLITHRQTSLNKLEIKKGATQISTPELMKTKDKILKNNEVVKPSDSVNISCISNKSKDSSILNIINGKNCKSVSSSVGSKAFIKNIENKRGGIVTQRPNFNRKTLKPSFDNKENMLDNNSNIERRNHLGKEKEKITNKSIEIMKNGFNNQEKNDGDGDLSKYLKTEIDFTPKSKKTIKVF